MARIDDVRRLLQEGGLEVERCERLANNTGYQVRCRGGEIINVFDKGTVQVQGKNQDRVKDLLKVPPPTGKAAPVSRRVFVVYGHDATARAQLEAMLRRWNLEPIILDQLPSEGQTLIEKLEKYTNDD